MRFSPGCGCCVSPRPCAPCGSVVLPETIFVAFTGGACDCLSGSFPLTWSATVAGGNNWLYRSTCPGYINHSISGGYNPNNLDYFGFGINFRCAGTTAFEMVVSWRVPGPASYNFTGFAFITTSGNTCSPLNIVFPSFSVNFGSVGAPCGSPAVIPTSALVTE